MLWNESEFKDYRKKARVHDELFRLLEIRLLEAERRILQLETHARRSS